MLSKYPFFIYHHGIKFTSARENEVMAENKPSSMKGNRYGTLDISRAIRIIQLFLVVALKASK